MDKTTYKITDWSGSIPKQCGICGDKIKDEFIDGATRFSGKPWTIMCPACFKDYGVGLGTGKGQRFIK